MLCYRRVLIKYDKQRQNVPNSASKKLFGGQNSNQFFNDTENTSDMLQRGRFLKRKSHYRNQAKYILCFNQQRLLQKQGQNDGCYYFTNTQSKLTPNK